MQVTNEKLANQYNMVKINEDIKAVATSINEKLPSIEDYNELKNRIENLDKKVLSGSSVPTYFSASTSKHFTTVHGSIPFPIIIAESNSGFDGQSGTLTVKMSGLYYFTVTVMKMSSTTTRIFLMHND